MISILLVDDQALVRTGFRMILENAPDMRVIGEAGDGAEGARLALEQRPDIVLMDVRMPGVDGVEATRRICAADSAGETKVLILTTFDLDEFVHAALHAGASGFLLKDTLTCYQPSAWSRVARRSWHRPPPAGCSTASSPRVPARPSRPHWSTC